MLTYSPKRPSLARGDSNESFASASVRDMETQLPIPRPPLRNVRSDTALKRLSQRYSNVLRKHKSHAFIKIPPVPTNASSVPPTPMSALLHFDPTYSPLLASPVLGYFAHTDVPHTGAQPVSRANRLSNSQAPSLYNRTPTSPSLGSPSEDGRSSQYQSAYSGSPYPQANGMVAVDYPSMSPSAGPPVSRLYSSPSSSSLTGKSVPMPGSLIPSRAAPAPPGSSNISPTYASPSSSSFFPAQPAKGGGFRRPNQTQPSPTLQQSPAPDLGPEHVLPDPSVGMPSGPPPLGLAEKRRSVGASPSGVKAQRSSYIAGSRPLFSPGAGPSRPSLNSSQSGPNVLMKRRPSNPPALSGQPSSPPSAGAMSTLPFQRAAPTGEQALYRFRRCLLLIVAWVQDWTAPGRWLEMSSSNQK